MNIYIEMHVFTNMTLANGYEIEALCVRMHHLPKYKSQLLKYVNPTP
jgi:hypothetical protein